MTTAPVISAAQVGSNIVASWSDEPPADVTYGAGTTTNPNNYADGTSENPYVVAGAGMDNTILNGHLDFGSYQEFRDMTITATTDSATTNKNGASWTVFRRCRFKGGGGASGSTKTPVSLGHGYAVNNVSFIDCEVACNAAAENPSMSNGYNNVTIHQEGSGLVHDISFTGCHIGVTNGTRKGSPRMGVEVVWNDGTQAWYNVSFTNCVVEACDAHGIDFSDAYNHRSDGAVVTGCTIKGAGLVSTAPWASCIDIEYPTGAVITNNVIYRGKEYALQMANRGDSYAEPVGAVITGNVFHLTYDNGVTGPTTEAGAIYLMGSGNTYSGNTFD